jgi:aspartyl-tRNA(Asn)/glutamyl-tRNA(Gln) amidotransferase subunit B
VQETRGWSEKAGKTVRQRIKETSADYRYFPEPDIPPVEINKEWIEKIKRHLVELPPAKKKRFREEYDLSEYDADILVCDKDLANFTEEVFSELREWINSNGDTWERQKKKLAKIASNYLTSELFKHLNTEGGTINEIKFNAENFAELIALVYQEKVNSSAAQKILEVMYQKGGDPTNIMEGLGLEQIHSEEELEKTVKKIIEDNPKVVAEYKNGKSNSIQFLVGKTMAATGGKANPKVVLELLNKLLQ